MGLAAYNPNEDRILGPETQVSSPKRRFPCKSEPLRICDTYMHTRRIINMSSLTSIYLFIYIHPDISHAT